MDFIRNTSEKVFNWTEAHFFGSTSYEIHTLAQLDLWRRIFLIT